MEFEHCKMLGVAGPLIILVGGFLSGVSSLLFNINFWNIPQIVGALCILVSLYHLANFYNAKNIFINARTGALIIIIGNIALNIVPFIIDNIALNIAPFTQFNTAVPAIITGLLIFTILVVTYTIAAIFMRRSLRELSNCSGNTKFKEAGQLLLIGAICLIILVGIILILIALLMLSEAFLALKNPNPQTQIHNRTSASIVAHLYQLMPYFASNAENKHIQTKLPSFFI